MHRSHPWVVVDRVVRIILTFAVIGATILVLVLFALLLMALVAPDVTKALLGEGVLD